MPQINRERLLSDLKTLRTFGAMDNGVVRRALSPVDVEARKWLMQKYTEAGLDAEMDQLANVIGRTKNPGKPLLIGSHSDTQPRGGWLDGALGVIYGLEVARALGEDPTTKHLPVDAVSWQDEESAFMSCMGSRSFCGMTTHEEEAAASDDDGRPLFQAIEEAGLKDHPRFKCPDDHYHGYLEAHIEQGAFLVDADEKIGVVTGIVGIRGLNIKITGQQNHAGTTTMARRADASTALVEFAYKIHQEFPKLANEATVWTMGKMDVHPGATSIVPGYAEVHLQFRDRTEDLLDALEAKAMEVAEEVNGASKCELVVEQGRSPLRASPMNDGFQGHIRDAAEAHHPGKWRSMPSAAAHDAQILSSKMPSAMMFIPSLGGISHDFAEDSRDEDIMDGGQVLADAAAAILLEAQG